MNTEKIEFVRKDLKTSVGESADSLNQLKNTCILISGGTGFMGTWLAELIAFLNDEYQFNIHLILLARDSQEFEAKAPHIFGRKDVELINKDVRSIIDLPDSVSWIIHAASTPDNRVHSSNPLKTMQIVSQGTSAILDASTRLPKLKKILNISSGLVYGAQPWDMDGIPESFFGPLDCSAMSSVYAEAKRFGENLCAVYRSGYRLPVVNARPFAFIGPYQYLDRPWAINNFIRDSLLGGEIRILGDGETLRSYMYASDMAWWLLSIVVNGNTGMNYNVGSPDAISLRKLSEKIASNFSNSPEIVSRVSKSEVLNRSKFIPDVRSALNNLHLKINVTLDTAIMRTVIWNKSLYNQKKGESL
jgi:nucleoside-diphosphate-sugar epimerase